MKKPIILLYLFFLTPIIFGQKPKAPTEKELVRQHVINKTRSSLELPKYFKLEKIIIELTDKPELKTLDIGVNEVYLNDTTQRAKYMIADETFIHGELNWFEAYKIDTFYEVPYYKYKIQYQKNGFQEVMDYSASYDGLKFYTKIKKHSYKTSAYYSTRIIYWAMSNGGTVRLYSDNGIAAVDSKKKITYEVIEE